VTGASRQVSLSELKRLTRLESVSPDKLLHMFAERTNENGVIDRENFFECFLELAGDDLSKEDSTKLRVVLAGLYDLFDTNDQDGVDFAEIGSGFSILTGGKKDIKAAVAFSLYDVDDNGVISMDEMINYLESVFKILYHSHPGTEDEVGMNAKDLAIETAKEAFSRADKNHDSVLSYNEFCAWYSNTDLDCDEEEEEGEDVDGVVVKRLGILANLRAFEASEILQMFANRVSDRGNISYNVFHDIIESVSVTRDKPLTSHEKKMLDKKMKAIYESLDTNQDGQVQFSELAAGLTVLCGGTANSKIETAFELFDMNNDRMISQDEMFRYLRSVYAIVYEADSTARTRMGGADPDELALATTADAFERLGKGPGESLSFSEFKQWCELDDAKVVREASSKISLGEARRLTCLDSMRVHDVFECFMRRTTKSDGTISRRCFRETIEELSTMGGTRVLSDKDQDRLRVLISGLYDQFDVNNDGMCSTVEMISGLTILCGGDVEEKAKIAFDLYDTDRSGTISREEMQIHLKSVFRVVYHTDTQMAERKFSLSLSFSFSAMHFKQNIPNTSGTGVDVNVLSEETTRHAFENADLNPDGTMSYDAFRQWYLTTAAQEEEESKQENDNEEEGKSEESLDQTVVSSEESWITLEEIRRVTNLQYYDLDDIVNRFMEVADDDGRMDMSTFYNVMIEFATNKQETISSNDEEKLRHVLHHLFRIFDTNKDSRIDSGELIAGLSALVGGKRDKKTKIAFVLFDSSGDGYIQLEEMARYLYCVYRVIYAAEPSTKQRAGGLSEKQLAINTAKQAFEKADIDKDGKLSFEEFKAW
jgi:Ca2+-binding EF-hand superfamily protein